MRILTLILSLLLSTLLPAQWLDGHIQDRNGQALVGASLKLSWAPLGTSSDAKGHFRLRLDSVVSGGHLEVSSLGYRSQRILLDSILQHLDIILEEDRLGLEEIVVSGNRQAIARYQSAIIVERLDPKLFEQTAAISLAEGLSFSPGLRLENNCSNCGFTQLRINGLDGAYTQILINSRPIFSSLMAVYGLELIPAQMIERVEVVRGGGSALYGGNAIGGTVNIITKEAKDAQFSAKSTAQLINGEAWEHSESFGASLTNDDLSTGLNLFGFNRNRQDWDANNDGFSEMTRLRNQTLGLNAYWKPATRQKLSVDLFTINEFRRGGSDFDLLPHQAQIAEQLEHQIIGGGLAFEGLSTDGLHQYSVYTSSQKTDRQSYYGAGGRVIGNNDSLSTNDLLALNAYGDANDYSFVAGGLYNWQWHPQLQLSTGVEYQLQQVEDRMAGYQRSIFQRVQSLGSYFQLNYQPNTLWKIQIGNRLDINNIDGLYQLLSDNIHQNNDFVNVSPRLNLQYQLNKLWHFRASYARGFRNPQAFNEDLHIETVGGSALFIRLDENLQSETSHSINTSVDYLIIKSFSEHRILLTGFYTRLTNPFVLIDRQTLANGTAVQLKSNGEAGLVQGFSLEYQGAWSHGLSVQGSLTLQEAFYKEEQELWKSPLDDDRGAVNSDQMLRTPGFYGYVNADYRLSKWWTLSAALNYTGPMDLVRLVDPDTEFLELKRSAHFFDAQFSIERHLIAKKEWTVKTRLGLKNIFDAYQNDIEVGANKDASYVYGPIQPRTFFLSLSFDFLP